MRPSHNAQLMFDSRCGGLIHPESASEHASSTYFSTKPYRSLCSTDRQV